MADIDELMDLREDSWREAYQGIIPHGALQSMLTGRGEKWWQASVRHGALRVITLDEELAGYAAFGRNRHINLPYTGEIIEIYMAPVFQGLGLGKRLLEDARYQLKRMQFTPYLVWALEENERACAFYLRQGARPVGETYETFGTQTLRKIAFGFPS